MEINLQNIPFTITHEQIHFQKGESTLHRMLEGVSYFYKEYNVENFFDLSWRELESFVRSENHKQTMQADGEEFNLFIELKFQVLTYHLLSEFQLKSTLDKKQRLSEQSLFLSKFLESLNEGLMSRYISKLHLLAFSDESVALDMELKENLPPLYLRGLEFLLQKVMNSSSMKLIVDNTTLL